MLELLGSLARATFFRRLLAAAARAELAAPDGAGAGAHVCDALRLPRPAEGQVTVLPLLHGVDPCSNCWSCCCMPFSPHLCRDKPFPG